MGKINSSQTVNGDELNLVCQSNLSRSNLWLNLSDPIDNMSEGLIVSLKCFAKFKLIIVTLIKSAHCHPVYIL